MYCIDLQSGVKYKLIEKGTDYRRIQAHSSQDSYWYTLAEFLTYFRVLH